MALNDYVAQVQRILHDASAQFWSRDDVIKYINEARIRTVRDTGSYRRLQPLYLSTGLEVYPFGGVTGFNITAQGTGYVTAPVVTVAPPTTTGGITATATAVVTAGKVTGINITNAGTLYDATPAVTIGGPGTGAAATAYFINQQTIDCVNFTVYWGNSRRVLSQLNWSKFNAFARGWVSYLGLPTLFSTYSYNSIYIAKIPDQAYQAEIDSVMQPPPLVNDSTLEVIPIVMRDPVQYFAAHLAKIKSQKWSEADVLYARYNTEVIKAINSSFTRRSRNPYFQT